MTPTTSARMRAALCFFLTLAVGVVSRKVHVGWALWDKSLGDVLYTVLMYFGLGVVWPRSDPRARAFVAFAICIALELFQATGIPIALAQRRPWVHWILGGAFDWADIACYTLAGAILWALGHCQSRNRRQIPVQP